MLYLHLLALNVVAYVVLFLLSFAAVLPVLKQI